MLFVIFSSFLWAQTYTTLIEAGLSKTIDQHCNCFEVTNSGSKDIVVPHKHENEILSFINNTPPAITINACTAGGKATPPTLDIPDLSGVGNCSYKSPTAYIGGIPNKAAQSLRVRKVGLANCNLGLLINDVSITTITTSNAAFSVCQNNAIALSVSCKSGLQSGSVIIETSSGAAVDTVSVSLNYIGDCI